MTLPSPSNRQFILLTALVFSCFMWFRSCSEKNRVQAEAKREKKINEQNQRALTGVLQQLKNKAGEVEAVKSAFVTKVSELQKLNTDLYGELRKEIGNVKSLIKSQVVIDRGEVMVSNELLKYPDNITYGLKFKDTYTDSALTWIINGQSRFKLQEGVIYPGSTTINQNSIKVKMVMGFKENKDNYEVWARSASPLVKFDHLNGVILIPKKPDLTCPPASRVKRFGVGPTIGYGLSQDLRLTPFVGIGLSWNPIRF